MSAETLNLARNSRRKSGGRWLKLLFLAFLLFHVCAYAEEARKVKSNPPPEYPELAKRLNLRGVARVQVTVTPEGNVKEVKEVGGNPVPVDALVRAVKKWKYEPADKTSVIEVRYEFVPQ